jgi:hypothetical protein
MIAPRPYIIYQLPKSKTSHALKGGRIEKVWNNIKLFLTACTNVNIEMVSSIYINGFSADEEHGEPPTLADRIHEDTQRVFGKGETYPLGYHYPSNIPIKQTRTQWDLAISDLYKAVNYMIEGQPWPKYNLGPVELILSYDFKLIDPMTKIELPSQQFTSSILISLSRSNWISPSLCFPFEEPINGFWEYINGIESYFPFKFDKKHLRSVRSNKKGTANIFSKL